MNEIEKLYENAGLSNMWVEEYDDKQFWHGCYIEMIQSMMKLNDWDRKTATSVAHKECRKALPPFTAEKQIELIKWLARHNFVVCKNLGGWHTGINPTYDEDFGITCSKRATNLGSFEYALAGLINNLWQDLTEEEKEQIRGILNGN